MEKHVGVFGICYFYRIVVIFFRNFRGIVTSMIRKLPSVLRAKINNLINRNLFHAKKTFRS